MQRIAILGGGRIGEALLSGLISANWGDIVVTARSEGRVAELRERHGVEATTSNRDAVAGAALVVVAVKPQDIDALLEDIGASLSTDQTVLSVAAAIPTAYIEARIADGVPVVRAMPNAPSVVHEGMAGIAAGVARGRRAARARGGGADASRPRRARPRERDGRGHRAFRLRARRTSRSLPRR